MSRLATLAETEAQRRRREREELALLLLLFGWDVYLLRFRAPNGKLVQQQAVKNAVNTVIAGAKLRLAQLAQQVASGEITVAEWQLVTASVLKLLHLAVAAVAFGGFEQMDADAYGLVAEHLRFHLEKLNQFAQDIARGFSGTSGVIFGEGIFGFGAVMTPARIMARAQLYAAGANSTYETIRRATAVAAGFKFEQNILHGAEHCQSTALTVGCVEQTALGWVSLGELVPPGSRTCRVNCLCTLNFARELGEGFAIVTP